MYRSKYSLRGFTLVELLVVMAIMSVLIGISVAGLGYAMRRSRNIARQAAVTNLDRALESYYSDQQQYPDNTTAPTITSLVAAGTGLLDVYLEGSWDVPVKTCVVYYSLDGVRYVTGASQEDARGDNDMYWAGPGLNYSTGGYPATRITELNITAATQAAQEFTSLRAWAADCSAITGI